jgi:thymidylate kinase
MSSRFIVFEGLDGVGKTTQIELLSKKIKTKRKTCVIHKEPDESLEYCALVHKLVTNDKEINNEGLGLIMTISARLYEYYTRLTKSFNEYDFVLLDRYIYSALVYQSRLWEMIEKNNGKANIHQCKYFKLLRDYLELMSLKKPLVLYLYLSKEEREKRILDNRLNNDLFLNDDKKSLDIFSLKHHDGLDKAYEYFFKLYRPENLIKIDCDNKNEKEINDYILSRCNII